MEIGACHDYLQRGSSLPQVPLSAMSSQKVSCDHSDYLSGKAALEATLIFFFIQSVSLKETESSWPNNMRRHSALLENIAQKGQKYPVCISKSVRIGVLRTTDYREQNSSLSGMVWCIARTKLIKGSTEHIRLLQCILWLRFYRNWPFTCSSCVSNTSDTKSLQ